MTDQADAMIGGDAIDVLAYLVARNVEIAKCFLFEPPFPPLLQEDRTFGSEAEVVDRALSLRATSGLPFWDAVMLLSSATELVPVEVFKAALRHNRPQDNRFQSIDTTRLDTDSIRLLGASMKSDRLLALQSRVLLRDGTVEHIPMLDFHVQASDRSLSVVEAVLRSLGLSGFVLNSGKSYHFYGDELIGETRLTAFLGKALLFSPIVDRAWIAHQLIESACALRISARSDYGGPPRIVARVIGKT